VYLGEIFSALIFLGLCAGGKIGMVPFDFLLSFSIFYLSTYVSDVERFFSSLKDMGGEVYE
jgi:hypothetical protein